MPEPSAAELARAWICVATTDRRLRTERRTALAALGRWPRDAVLAAAESLASGQVDRLWTHGWQPSELYRHGRVGRHRAQVRRLIEVTVAGDCARRLASDEPLGPGWRHQAELVAADQRVPGHGWLARWIAPLDLTDATAYELVADALLALLTLPGIDAVSPPEREGLPGHLRGTASSDSLLRRIRNLLAKAESTEFEAEAIAFTSKAQELITKHAIDAAVLTGEQSSTAVPVMVRVPIDPPYVDAKSLLLQTIASATRCRALFMPQVMSSTVVGFETDLAAVELLFASLLVQAQQAMVAAGGASAPGSTTRSRDFRATFLLAYATRIGERLEEVNEHVYATTSSSSSLFLPVLAARQDAVADVVATRFGELREDRVRGTDPAGWLSGRLAADQARLTSGVLDEG